MAMRETVRSLKAYFIVSAILSAFVNLRVIGAGGGLALAIGGIGLGFALAFLYVGVRLRQLLATSPAQVTTLLVAAASFTVLIFLLNLMSGAGAGSVPFLLFGLLILWYLFTNVRRLAAEAQSAAPIASSGPGSVGA
jgi:hypothetical protein